MSHVASAKRTNPACIMTLKSSILLLALACASTGFADDAVLHDFGDKAALPNAKARATQLSLAAIENGPALRVVASTGDDWPGVNFPAPDGIDWSQHGCLLVPVKKSHHRPARRNATAPGEKANSLIERDVGARSSPSDFHSTRWKG